MQTAEPKSGTAQESDNQNSKSNRPSVITEQKGFVNCKDVTSDATNTTLSDQDSKNGQGNITSDTQLAQNAQQTQMSNVQSDTQKNQQSTTNEKPNTTDLRQLRRPSKGTPPLPSGQEESKTRLTRSRTKEEYGTPEATPTSETQTKDAKLTDPQSDDIDKLFPLIDAAAPHNSQYPGIKQPIIKLDRLSTEDIQKSLKEFTDSKPKLALELGLIPPKEKKSYKEKSESEEEGEERSSKRKGGKRKADSEDEYQPADSFSALVGSTKRRKLAPKDEKPETPIVVKPKLRRVEKKFVPVIEKLSQEELMETNTYLRFNKSVEIVLKSAEDYDSAEIGEDGIIPEEYLLSRTVMQELCTETAKLKILGAMEMIPTDTLTRLLNVLEVNIRGGDRVSPVGDEDDNESIRQLWLESTMERVMGAADASLVCMYIMTSPNMSKRVYLEDVIDRVVLFIKYQLHNTIFPSFDSTYRLDNKKKDGRRKKTTPVSEKNILMLYTKTSELVNLLAELLNIQVLTDTSVLHASSMGVSPFFAENVSELQLACLKLVTTVSSTTF